MGGDYDVLFIETPLSSISFIYCSLGALHSLQPGVDDDGYSSPKIPALKKKGYVTWQTIQLLLGPEEHVSFLQNAVAQFDVKDPETGAIFPKVLPKECLPSRPDDAMETWYEGVADRLRREAEPDVVGPESVPRRRVNVEGPSPRTSSEMSDGSANERHAAAKYFSDPLYRKARPRPPFVRHYSRERPYEQDRPADRNKLISSVRHMLNPLISRRKSLPPARDDDDFSDEDATPLAWAPPPASRYASHKRPHPPRKESTLSTTDDSDSDSDRPPSRRRTPVLRHRRSHEPSTSPREYFPPYYEDLPPERRYSHDPRPPGSGRKEDGPPPLYGPTKSPLFATHVANANLQANKYYDRPRPTMSAPRTSYRPSVRYAAAPPEVDAPYVREREREYEPLSGTSRHRRRSEDYPRERERDRDRGDGGRTRSHDRVRDEWDERETPSRDRSSEGREAVGRGHRHVAGVQVGAGGRRYPVEQPWR